MTCDWCGNEAVGYWPDMWWCSFHEKVAAYIVNLRYETMESAMAEYVGMGMHQYQESALDTFTSRTGETHNEMVARIGFGICGEAGEIAEAIKKYLRGDYDFRTLQHRIQPELGDVLWYVAIMAKLMGVSLDDVAEDNLNKLASRKERGVLQGSGDNR